MENLYKLNEYSGNLPNPMHFPLRGGLVIAVSDRPNAFSDGFMLDLFVRDTEKEDLAERAIRIVPFSNLVGIITDAENSQLLLSKPEYIHDMLYLGYVLFTPDNNPVVVQVKYYRYFRNRYPKCQFYSKDGYFGIIAIKVGNKLVGACMPMAIKLENIERLGEKEDGQ